MRGARSRPRKPSRRRPPAPSAAEARRRLALAVDSIADGFYALDPDWRFSHVNDAALAYFGKTRDEMLGRSLFDVFPAVRGTVFEAEYRRAMETGEAVHFTAPSVLTGRTVEMHAYPGPADMTVLFRDVTEQRLTQDALRDSEERLALALEVSQMGTWDLDLRRHTAWRSLRHDQIFGYGALLPSWTYETFLEHVLPEDRAEVDRRFREAVAAQHDWEFQCRIRRVDGAVRWIWARGRGQYGQDGEPVRMLGLVQDVTPEKEAELQLEASIAERKRAEEELGENRKRYQALVETNVDCIWEMDARGRYTYCSPQMERLWGIKPEDMIGRTPFDVMPEDERETARRVFLAMTRSPAPFSGLESSALDARGRLILVETSGIPFFDERGGLLGFRGTTRDVTERRRAEEALREANARLTEADQRKNQFLATLSHELRNPLAPIRNSLYVLDHAPAGGDQARRARDVIGRQVDQLSRLVDDLLDVTRITRGTIQLQRRRLELNELVRRTLEDHRTLFESAGLDVEFEPAPRQVFIDGDWNRVAQVVGNLLQNSAKFTPAGGRVSIRASTDPAARQAVLRVADTGAGVAPELLELLFEPFMQAEATLARSRGGLGLGLALAKELVELHGGSIDARSPGLGQGAEFTVRLPLDLTEPVPVERERIVPSRAPRRVLVIEDSVDAADSLRDVLQVQGHEVAVAYDGPQGIARAREFRPDVVFCDIGLPGMDGYEVARAFRADGGLPVARLVALSGYALPEDLQRAAEAGFDRHIAKPPSLEQLADVLAGV